MRYASLAVIFVNTLFEIGCKSTSFFLDGWENIMGLSIMGLPMCQLSPVAGLKSDNLIQQITSHFLVLPIRYPFDTGSILVRLILEARRVLDFGVGRWILSGVNGMAGFSCPTWVIYWMLKCLFFVSLLSVFGLWICESAGFLFDTQCVEKIRLSDKSTWNDRLSETYTL